MVGEARLASYHNAAFFSTRHAARIPSEFFLGEMPPPIPPPASLPLPRARSLRSFALISRRWLDHVRESTSRSDVSESSTHSHVDDGDEKDDVLSDSLLVSPLRLFQSWNSFVIDIAFCLPVSVRQAITSSQASRVKLSSRHPRRSRLSLTVDSAHSTLNLDALF